MPPGIGNGQRTAGAGNFADQTLAITDGYLMRHIGIEPVRREQFQIAVIDRDITGRGVGIHFFGNDFDDFRELDRRFILSFGDLTQKFQNVHRLIYGR